MHSVRSWSSHLSMTFHLPSSDHIHYNILLRRLAYIVTMYHRWRPALRSLSLSISYTLLSIYLLLTPYFTCCSLSPPSINLFASLALHAFSRNRHTLFALAQIHVTAFVAHLPLASNLISLNLTSHLGPDHTTPPYRNQTLRTHLPLLSPLQVFLFP